MVACDVVGDIEKIMLLAAGLCLPQDFLNHFGAVFTVPFHDRIFLRRQLAWLVQHGFRNFQLAEVMKRRRTQDILRVQVGNPVLEERAPLHFPDEPLHVILPAEELTPRERLPFLDHIRKSRDHVVEHILAPHPVRELPCLPLGELNIEQHPHRHEQQDMYDIEAERHRLAYKGRPDQERRRE